MVSDGHSGSVIPPFLVPRCHHVRRDRTACRGAKRDIVRAGPGRKAAARRASAIRQPFGAACMNTRATDHPMPATNTLRALSTAFRYRRLTAWSTVRDNGRRSASVLRVSDHLALTLARSIRAERARAGLSQAQLAHRLGWSQQVQASIETGGRRLYAHELPDICRALGVPLATLLIGAAPEDLEALGV